MLISEFRVSVFTNWVHLVENRWRMKLGNLADVWGFVVDFVVDVVVDVVSS